MLFKARLLSAPAHPVTLWRPSTSEFSWPHDHRADLPGRSRGALICTDLRSLLSLVTIFFISRAAAKTSYGRPRDFLGAHTRPFFELHGVSLDRELSVCAIRTCKTTTVDAIATSNNSMPSKIPLVCSVLFKNWELWIGLLTSLND